MAERTTGSGNLGDRVRGQTTTTLRIPPPNIAQTGFVPVRVGTLAQSESIDPGGVLFPGLLGVISPQGMQTTLGQEDHSVADRVSERAWPTGRKGSSCRGGAWLVCGELCQLVDERRGNAHRQAQRRLILGGQHVK